MFVCLSVCLCVDSALFGKHCCTRRKNYTLLILYPGSVLSHCSPILKHIGPNYTKRSMSWLLVFLSAICSLIHVPHLFATHETCIPLCLKWQRSLKHVKNVFTYANRKNAGQSMGIIYTHYDGLDIDATYKVSCKSVQWFWSIF